MDDGDDIPPRSESGDVTVDCEGCEGEVLPNKPRISSTVLFCFCAGLVASVLEESPPNISAKRSAVFCLFRLDAPLVAGVETISSPSKSAFDAN